MSVHGAVCLLALLANEEKDAVVTLVERPNIPPVEERSFVCNVIAMLLVVYDGEAMICTRRSSPESTSAIPMPTFTTELPLSLLDGFTRAILLCTLTPPTIQRSPVPEFSQSPWVLILGSFIIVNVGFFLTNLFSFFLPTPLALTTPSELLPYGWTTTDL
ncbi:hypothetical protein SCLCIDRAFT_10511 [Scleroderma citrinum Foug A]|uniref:Uncharacterized protein n=1 Tax=Scleroderma citrinum Foug A TaxID=1036808 RepID=A0A0C3DMH7_9AGAM|nr:hypothetical protein SCLCIDRAFT_10511 [Scleroderma citrinum Foug A]